MLYGIEDGTLGNLVEHDARGVPLVQSEHLAEMPTDGLSLAVLIGCQPNVAGCLGAFLQVGHYFLLLLGNLIVGFESIFIDAEFFFLQVADVSVRRHHLKILAKKFLYGLGLGRTLYDNQIILHTST